MRGKIRVFLIVCVVLLTAMVCQPADNPWLPDGVHPQPPKVTDHIITDDGTWADATEAMNEAITTWNENNNNGCGYHFVQSAGGSEPPVIAEGALITT